MFKVGDKVWCTLYGEGEVDELFTGLNPVGVKFKSDYYEFYTPDGRIELELPPTLGFVKVEIPKPVQVKPMPKWRANYNGGYFHVNTMGFINDTIEVGDSTDRGRFKVGNYFQTEQEAKESKFYKVFHEED